MKTIAPENLAAQDCPGQVLRDTSFVSERVGLAPIVGYAYGRFDDVCNPITVETGRHYSVVEFKIAAIWHFGKRAGE
jgi:hypothetical protein